MWATLEIAGYWGIVFTSKLPAITPHETFKLFVTFGLTTAGCLVHVSLMTVPIPPGMPLLSPSTPCTPIIDGGMAASFTCLIAVGILLGACNSLINI
jgi:hypothetical protein